MGRVARGSHCYALNRLLEAQDVQVANGSIFSAAGKYRHCLRLNFATPASRKIEMAVAKVGQAIGQLLPGFRATPKRCGYEQGMNAFAAYPLG